MPSKAEVFDFLDQPSREAMSRPAGSTLPSQIPREIGSMMGIEVTPIARTPQAACVRPYDGRRRPFVPKEEKTELPVKFNYF